MRSVVFFDETRALIGFWEDVEEADEARRARPKFWDPGAEGQAYENAGRCAEESDPTDEDEDDGDERRRRATEDASRPRSTGSLCLLSVSSELL